MRGLVFASKHSLRTKRDDARCVAVIYVIRHPESCCSRPIGQDEARRGRDRRKVHLQTGGERMAGCKTKSCLLRGSSSSSTEADFYLSLGNSIEGLHVSIYGLFVNVFIYGTSVSERDSERSDKNLWMALSGLLTCPPSEPPVPLGWAPSSNRGIIQAAIYCDKRALL